MNPSVAVPLVCAPAVAALAACDFESGISHQRVLRLWAAHYIYSARCRRVDRSWTWGPSAATGALVFRFGTQQLRQPYASRPLRKALRDTVGAAKDAEPPADVSRDTLCKGCWAATRVQEPVHVPPADSYSLTAAALAAIPATTPSSLLNRMRGPQSVILDAQPHTRHGAALAKLHYRCTNWARPGAAARLTKLGHVPGADNTCGWLSSDVEEHVVPHAAW